ncbi:MAG: anhydro-N-acetylmuramic acid kinase, partial [Rhodothermales bacterium]|nr:anhydro-N-acetylmuramic acid kinase [Rhodothermales bacterium]
VSDAVVRLTVFGDKTFQLVVGGGGAHNGYVMRRFEALLPTAEVMTTERFGIIPDAREAVCFAVLAHETLNEQASAIASVTGASRSAVLGKICLPTMDVNG